MTFEDYQEACCKSACDAASLDWIEFLEDENNLEELFDYWNTLNQNEMDTEKSNIIYDTIMGRIENHAIQSEKGSSIFQECNIRQELPQADHQLVVNR